MKIFKKKGPSEGASMPRGKGNTILMGGRWRKLPEWKGGHRIMYWREHREVQRVRRINGNV